MELGFQTVISQFSFAFSKAAWKKAEVLLRGAICCPGSRTVCNILRTVGLADCEAFHKYHRLLSRDKWSAISLSNCLLGLLVETFVPQGEALVFGIDETIERRGEKRLPSEVFTVILSGHQPLILSNVVV